MGSEKEQVEGDRKRRRRESGARWLAKNTDYHKLWREKNREALRIKDRVYYKENQGREHQQRWRAENKDAILARELEKQVTDPTRVEQKQASSRERSQRYRGKNPTKGRDYQRTWREANPEAAKQKNKEGQASLMSDPERLERKRKYAREYQKTLRKRNPRKWRSNKLKSSYGITLEEYEGMLEEQGGVCAICKQQETALARCGDGMTKVASLAVDHCHTANKVRGLLCANCNRGLGLFKHSSTRLIQAIQYLESHRTT